MIPVAAQEEAVIQKVNSAVMRNFTAFVRFLVTKATYFALKRKKRLSRKRRRSLSHRNQYVDSPFTAPTSSGVSILKKKPLGQYKSSPSLLIKSKCAQRANHLFLRNNKLLNLPN